MKRIYTLFLIFFLSVPLSAQLNDRAVDLSACGLNYIHKASIVATRAGGVGNPGTPMPITFNVSELPASCYRIEAAYAWWVVSYRNDTPVDGVLSLTDPQGAVRNVNAFMTGTGGNKCWNINPYNEIGTRAYRADITNLITGNGNYTLSTNTGNDMTDGITMLIFYRDLRSSYEGHVVIQDGLITVNSANIQTNATLDNFNVCAAPTTAVAFMIVSDLQKSISPTATLTINGAPVTVDRNFWNSEVRPVNLAANQNTSVFGVDAGNDCYSLAMMGLYYQTTTCRTCPERLNVTATGNDICQGGSVQLNAGGAASYEWSSNPAGFTSNQQNPTVSPTVTTTYTVRGLSADGCLEGTASVTVRVNPLPQTVITAGGPTSFCQGGSVWLDAGGFASYLWSNGETTRTILVSTSGSYSVTVIDNNGCRNTSAPVRVTVFPLPQPVITPKGPTTICSCDSVELDADNKGYISYLWSNGATTRSIMVRTQGNYTVTVTDTNGCRNTSPPLAITVLVPSADVGLDSTVYHSTPGDTLNIPLMLLASANLDFCKLMNFEAVISFNSTVLVPQGTTPKGTITGDRRTITVTGTRNSQSQTLSNLKFLTTLGNSDNSQMRLESFRWLECQTTNSTQNSNLSLVQLCYQGSKTRLYRPGSSPLIMSIKPNPVDNSSILEYNLVEKGYTQIFIVDMLGRKISTVFEGMGEVGRHESVLDASGFASGLYMVVISTPTDNVTEMMEVSK